jgi:hypothetical protein
MKILQISRFVPKEVAEESRKVKVMSMVVTYWLKMLCMKNGDLLSMCYAWLMDNLKSTVEQRKH